MEHNFWIEFHNGDYRLPHGITIKLQDRAETGHYAGKLLQILLALLVLLLYVLTMILSLSRKNRRVRYV